MTTFSFFKAGTDILAAEKPQKFDWHDAAEKVQEELSKALNAQNISFLLGSGCSSFLHGNEQLGIPTMAPMAKTFLTTVNKDRENLYLTKQEKDLLSNELGINLDQGECSQNLERLMEVLFSAQLALKDTSNPSLSELKNIVDNSVKKVKNYVLKCCSEGKFSHGDSTVVKLYQNFYQKLVFRDSSLPRPWIFTTNYDLFNETAMDRMGIPYCNGFSGVVERRFNPSVFRYSLAEQLDISNRKWAAVNNFVYLCKLHGSISWVEDGQTLFPIREIPNHRSKGKSPVLIYPTPAKQNASLGSPYADLFREFQKQIVHEQSVLITIGYSFGDEHINNIIFQALTIPNFRLIIFLSPDTAGVLQELLALDDPRIWLIGGKGYNSESKAQYFDTFVEYFMPNTPGEKIDSAISKVLSLLAKKPNKPKNGEDNVF